MSEVGVAFDNQIAAAQPDQIHYCITQAGLCAITAGSPEYIATEVMDYITDSVPYSEPGKLPLTLMNR